MVFIRRCYCVRTCIENHAEKYSGETTVIPMRLAMELVKDIDIVAAMTG